MFSRSKLKNWQRARLHFFNENSFERYVWGAVSFTFALIRTVSVKVG